MPKMKHIFNYCDYRYSVLLGYTKGEFSIALAYACFYEMYPILNILDDDFEEFETRFVVSKDVVDTVYTAYLQLLESGEATVYKIVKHTDVDKFTCQRILAYMFLAGSLSNIKGLAARNECPHQFKEMFCEDPENFFSYTDDNYKQYLVQSFSTGLKEYLSVRYNNV